MVRQPKMSANPAEAMRGVEWREGFDPGSLIWNAELGFFEVPITDETTAMEGIKRKRLVGFGSPYPGTGSTDDTVVPVTELSELPEWVQTADRQVKGVGPRMHNVCQAAKGYAYRARYTGVFTFDVDTTRLRRLQSGLTARLFQSMRHLGRAIRAKQQSLSEVVESVHADYGDIDGVLMSLPLNAERRRRMRAVFDRSARMPKGITPEVIIVRKRQVLLHKIGEVAAGNA